MKVPFDALTVRPKIPYEIVKISDIQPLLEDGGKVKIIQFFPMTITADLLFIIWNWLREVIGDRNHIFGDSRVYYRFFRDNGSRGG